VLFIWRQIYSVKRDDSIKSPASNDTDDVQQEIINLSKQKWQWMADKNADSLNTLFDEKSVYVRMENGKIAEERDFFDNLEFMQQLGLIPRQ
jgi:hypothetical protein